MHDDKVLSTLSGSHDVKDRDIRLHKQASELRARTAERERLQKIVNQHQRTQDRLRQEVEFRMYSLKVREFHSVWPYLITDR